MKRRVAAILAADVVAYSRLMGEDEAGTFARLKSLRKELVQPKISGARGCVVKLMGDGLLAEFPRVVEAVRCAVDIQQNMAGREHGGICISGKVYEEVRDKLPAAFEDLGEREVKNFPEPVRVCR